MAPLRRTHQDSHVDERSKAHRKGRQEQTLMRMPKHSWKDMGMENVAKARYESEEKEEDEVEDEEDCGYDTEPVAVVGQLVEHD